DFHVTGVQTCALPISKASASWRSARTPGRQTEVGTKAMRSRRLPTGHRAMLAAAAVLASMSMASTFGEQSNTLLDQARIDRKAAAVLRERGDVDSVRAAVELERRAAEVERRAESLRSLGSNPAPAGTTPDASGAAQGRPASKISSTDASAPPRPDFRSAD